MRLFSLGILVLLGVTALGTGSAEPGEKPAPKAVKHPYVHTVIFYLKKDAAKGQADELIADCHKLLAKIPTVHGLRAGHPAEKATPKVAVTDYSVGLIIMFDDAAALQTYLDHPLHLQFVEKHMPHIERVLVYDFNNEHGK